MQSLDLALKLAPIIYVTRDLERAMAGLHLRNYYIITNATPFAKACAKKHKQIIIVQNREKLDTHELLEHKKTQDFVKRFAQFSLLVFKNTSQIEKICQKNNWRLLNPSATLASTVEEKISQVRWLGTLEKYLPPHEIKTCNDLTWQGQKYVVQFNRAHTGSGTILIETETQIEELKKTFPNREVRVTQFIEGPAITNNNVVWNKKVLVGNINYQITGLSPFTDLPFATIGNDWALPHQLLNKKQRDFYSRMATDIGQQLARDGWKGLFGMDVMIEQKTGQLYLIEINARQPASTTYESELQQTVIARSETTKQSQNSPEKNKGLLRFARNDKMTTSFDAHLMSLLGLPVESQLTPLTSGAQIIQRVTSLTKKITPSKKQTLSRLPVKTVHYTNKEPGADLLRIQTKNGIMKGRNVFNVFGTTLAYTLDPAYHTNYRAGVIIVQDKKILLMKRAHYNERYYSIPGGKPEHHETLEETAAREGKEETNLDFKIDLSREPLTHQAKKRGIYFFTKQVKGVARLGGPEIKRNSAKNYYELQWVDLKTLLKLTLRQAELKPALVQLLK